MHFNFFAYAWSERFYLAVLIKEHVALTLLSLLLAMAAALPLGMILSRRPAAAHLAFGAVNILQTIPSIALLGFLIPLLGIGVKPAIAALFFYALLPLLRNTYAGLMSIDPSLKEAARGMGLTDWQILRKVEIPLALPIIMAGIRTSAVIIVGTATVAALIGAGGLGNPIFRGIASLNTHTILLGALPAACLAVIFDRGLHLAEHFLVSPGLRKQQKLLTESFLRE